VITALIAIIVLSVNWGLGSLWAVTLSQLAVSDGDSWAFEMEGGIASAIVPNWQWSFSKSRVLLILLLLATVPFAVMWAL